VRREPCHPRTLRHSYLSLITYLPWLLDPLPPLPCELLPLLCEALPLLCEPPEFCELLLPDVPEPEPELVSLELPIPPRPDEPLCPQPAIKAAAAHTIINFFIMLSPF
jgi:hypothetical protein